MSDKISLKSVSQVAFPFLRSNIQEALVWLFYIIGSILKETKHMNYSFLASDHYFMFFCQNHLKEKGEITFQLLLAGTVPPFVFLLIYLDYMNFKGLFLCVESVLRSMRLVIPMQIFNYHVLSILILYQFRSSCFQACLFLN